MERKSIKILVNGKINLSLNIIGEMGGYHSLDMVLASVNIADAISISSRKDNNFTVKFNGADIDNQNNTVYKTLLVLKEYLPCGWDVSVDKQIPCEGGMGGSSADAAGVICALDNLLGLKSLGVELAAEGLKVGCDVPYMLKGGFARVFGRGDCVRELNSYVRLPMLIIQGKIGVSTKECYHKFDEIYKEKTYAPNDNGRLIEGIKNKDIFAIAGNVSNALYSAAKIIAPSLERDLNFMRELGAMSSFMTGSGSCIVGIFGESADRERLSEKCRKKGYLTKICETVEKGIKFV